jgi:hypothetical protein
VTCVTNVTAIYSELGAKLKGTTESKLFKHTKSIPFANFNGRACPLRTCISILHAHSL